MHSTDKGHQSLLPVSFSSLSTQNATRMFWNPLRASSGDTAKSLYQLASSERFLDYSHSWPRAQANWKWRIFTAFVFWKFNPVTKLTVEQFQKHSIWEKSRNPARDRKSLSGKVCHCSALAVLLKSMLMLTAYPTHLLRTMPNVCNYAGSHKWEWLDCIQRKITHSCLFHCSMLPGHGV